MTAQLDQQLAEAFKLSPISKGVFGGIFEDTAVVLQTLTVDPPAVMFQMPAVCKEKQKWELEDTIPKVFEGKGVHVEVEEGTAWLTIPDLSGATQNEVVSLLTIAIRDLQQKGMAAPTGCNVCGRNVKTTLAHRGTAIGKVCERCLQERTRQAKQRERESNAGSWPFWISLPAAIFIGAMAWAGGWIAFELNIIWAGGHLRISYYLLGFILLFGGVITTLPMGWLVKRCKCFHWISRRALGFASVGCAIAVGEFLFHFWFLWYSFGEVSYRTVIDNYVELLSMYEPFYIACKVWLLIVMSITTHIMLERKSVSIDLTPNR